MLFYRFCRFSLALAVCVIKSVYLERLINPNRARLRGPSARVWNQGFLLLGVFMAPPSNLRSGVFFFFFFLKGGKREKGKKTPDTFI